MRLTERSARILRPGMVDSYLVRQMFGPMSASFAVILIALLLYRILDIFNFMAGSSAMYSLIPRMILDVAPQYLGLAVPAAYFISMFVIVARLSDTNEIDALLASGVSIGRLAWPLMALGVFVAALNILLLGFAQPYGHYGFNVDLNEALHSGWDARVQPKAFTGLGPGFVLSADRVDPAGRALRGVFIRRAGDDGSEQVFTAARGAMTPSPGNTRLRLVLSDGQQVQERRGAQPVVGRFSNITVEMPLSGPVPGFRLRGIIPRELTIFELPGRMRDGSSDQRRRAAAEFHARIVRSISVPLLPLLAVPAGMAAKRRRRGVGAAACAAALFIYENGIDFGQSLADRGHVPAAAAVWVPFALFAAACALLFHQSRLRPGQTPFTAVTDGLERAFQAVRTRTAGADRSIAARLPKASR